MKFESLPARIVSVVMHFLPIAIVPAARAQTTVTEKTTTENPEEFSRVRGLFDVDLPKTVEKASLKLIVHPHFGDLLHRDYLRVPVGVRVGVNNHTEVSAEVESFLEHHLKKSGAGYGVGVLRLGGKYQWLDWLKPIVDTSTGLNTSIPVGRPPLDMTDGFYHVSPYVTFAKRWANHPKLAPFVSVGTDLIRDAHVRGSFAKNQPHSNSTSVSAGCFVDYSERFKYTLVSTYTTTTLLGNGNKNFLSVNPSILWQLPPMLTFHSKSRWIFGVGLKANFGPDGSEFGSSAKLRGEFSFARLFGAKP